MIKIGYKVQPRFHYREWLMKEEIKSILKARLKLRLNKHIKPTDQTTTVDTISLSSKNGEFKNVIKVDSNVQPRLLYREILMQEEEMKLLRKAKLKRLLNKDI